MKRKTRKTRNESGAGLIGVFIGLVCITVGIVVVVQTIKMKGRLNNAEQRLDMDDDRSLLIPSPDLRADNWRVKWTDFYAYEEDLRQRAMPVKAPGIRRGVVLWLEGNEVRLKMTSNAGWKNAEVNLDAIEQGWTAGEGVPVQLWRSSNLSEWFFVVLLDVTENEAIFIDEEMEGVAWFYKVMVP